MSVEEQRSQMVRLAAFLRQNPSAISKSPDEIASLCGVDAELVTSVLSVRGAHLYREGARYARPQPILAAWTRFRSFLNWFEPWLLAYVFGSSFLAAIAIRVSDENAFNSPSEVREVLQVVLMAVTAASHIVLYFRYGKSRYPLWGGLIVWGILSLVIASSSVINEPSGDLPKPLLAFIITIVMGIFGVGYAGFGVVFALLGAYRRVLREEKNERELSRQELLERLFQIEEALSVSKISRMEQEAEWMAAFKRVALPVAPVAGFLMSVLFLISAAFVPVPNGRTMPSPAFLLVYVGVGGMSMLMQILIAYLGGRPLRSVINSLLFFAGGVVASTAVMLIGRQFKVASYLSGPLVDSLTWQGQVGSFIFACVIGYFAGVGALVQERTLNARRKRLNDPQTLLEELVKIQLRLNPTSSVKCVAVFDAARSSQMKANADPLTAEWSFRAYQEFLRAIIEANDGVIHSTAGDGAVAIFNDCPSAWKASRCVQTKIPEFNQDTSRLSETFRLRVGLHCDTVAGDLGEVQFAAVIDIAAHAEAASQIGGICVTEPVKNLLPDERFAELEETIDGYRAFIALNPVADEA